MIRTKVMALAILTLSLGTAACGGDSSSTGPSDPPATGTGTITLLNESTTDIVAVQFSLCSDDDWGPNRLGASETLAPGAQRSWTVEPGCYDLKASNGSKSASWYDRDVASGGAVRLAVPGSLSSLTAGRIAPVSAGHKVR